MPTSQGAPVFGCGGWNSPVVPYADFRSFLAALRAQGDLVDIDRRIDIDGGVARALKRTYVRSGPALSFNDNGTAFPLVGGVYATRRHALLAFQADEATIFDRVLHGLDHPIAPRVVSEPAPAHDVVLTGADIDITAFPIPRYSPDDGGAYITAGIVVSKHPETGIPDIGHYRFMVLGPDRLAFFAQPSHRFGKHVAAAKRLGRSIEAAIVIGVDPLLAYTCQVQSSDDTNDWHVAGGLRGAPVDLVRAKTIDLEVPATAEVVIEFVCDPNELVMEGPLGEYTGYYTPASEEPVAHITAITHRHEPIFQALLTGKPVTENHILKQIPFEASFYRALKRQFPTVTNVAMPPSGGVSFWTVIAMEPRFAGEARQVILAAMATNVRPKYVIVVNSDIDVHDSSDVEWALAFRTRPARDTIVVDNVPSGPADPATEEEAERTLRVNSALGIDATVPFGTPFSKPADVPGWEDDAVPELDR